MMKNYLKIAIRNLIRQKGYSAINIAGLAIGIACCILIMLWVQDELSYDRFHQNAATLARVVIEDRSTGETRQVAVTPAPLAAKLKADIPDIIKATRAGWTRMALRYKDKVFNEGLFLADPDFLEMFTFPMLSGDPATALGDPHTILITEEMAAKYFGGTDPLGKIIRADGETDFIVTGILENLPANSSFKIDFIAPFEYLGEKENLDFWGAWRYYTFVQLAENTSLTAVNGKITRFLEANQPESDNSLYLQPVENLHLTTNLLYDSYGTGDIKYIWIFSALAFFILALAVINFVNLTTAQSGKRAPEIGLRQVVGAHRFNVIAQFFGESILTSFIAVLFAVGLVELLMPVFESVSGKQLPPNFIFDIHNITALTGLTLLTGILAGLYPALFLSSFKPISVLKKTLKLDSTAPAFRRILVVIQFAITVSLIIGTLVTGQQLNYMKNKKLGFDKESIIYVRFQGDAVTRYETMKHELLQSPHIARVTASFQLPTAIGSSPGAMDWEGKQPGQDFTINAGLVDYDYFETFGMKMAEGRAFSEEFPTDAERAYILNEEAVRQMGMASPVGKWFSFWDTPGTIIGVVEDFHSTSLHQAINPVVLRLDNYFLNYWYVKLNTSDISAGLESIERIWQKYNPDYPFEYRFLDESIARQYRSEEKTTGLFRYLTILAMIIASLGLFGLASYTAQRRTREIGIRKVLGASVSGILHLLSREYVILIMIANVIAWPVAWYAMSSWLGNFAYRIGFADFFWIFPVTALLVLILALLTVGIQSIRAATADPVASLRYE